MIPNFSGEPLLLSRFLEVCDRLYNNFHDNRNPDSFQNYFLFDSILSKISGKATEIVFSHHVQTYPELREILVSNYSDRRDFQTLTTEISRMSQRINETCFEFHNRIMKQLNSMIAYLQINKQQPEQIILSNFARDYALRIFINGLHESTAALLRARKCQSLDEVIIILQNEFNFAKTATNKSVQRSNYPPRTNNINNQPQKPHFSAPNQVSNFRPQSNFFQRPPFNPTNNPTNRPPFQRSYSSATQNKPPPRPQSNNGPRPYVPYNQPRNLHMMEDGNPVDDQSNEDPENQEPDQNLTPGFFDGSTFFPMPDLGNLSLKGVRKV